MQPDLTFLKGGISTVATSTWAVPLTCAANRESALVLYGRD
jgi:hypothetical protein